MESMLGVKATQVCDEYTEGQNYLQVKKLRQVNQLILFNNLRRDDRAVGSTMLLSFFNRVFSNLYSDKNTVSMVGTEDSEYKKIEMLRKLQQSDALEMGKAILDYDWLWDTLFFSQGYCETLEFDLKKKLLKPSIWNPLMTVYDPYFSNEQEWRYYGTWMSKTGHQLRALIENKTITGIKDLRAIRPGMDPELWNYKVMRDQAKDANPVIDDTESPNKIYQIYKHYTINSAGEKVMVWSDRNFKEILLAQKLDLRDADDGRGSKWPMVLKKAFREPHSSISYSIPDLVEDKHRAKAVLLNLSYLAAKDEANPIYAYDQGKIIDETQLLQRQISQHIATEGDPDQVIKPLRKSPALTNSLMSYIGILGNEAAEVIGTSQVSTPQPKGKKSATDSAILQQIADLTPSLQTKVLGIGEAEFWSHWYQRYNRFAKQGDEKIATMTNISGVTFEKIQLDEIKTKFPPKVIVLSSKEAEYKETILRRELSGQFPIFGKILKGRTLDNFLKFVYFPKFIQDSNTIDMMMPKSLDEIKAEQENEMLMDGKLAKLAPTDDDETHLYIHYRAKKSAEVWAHIFAHEKQRAMKAEAKQQQEQQSGQGGDQGVTEGEGEQSPFGDLAGGKQPKQKKPKSKDLQPGEAAVPLKQSTEQGIKMQPAANPVPK